MATHVDAKSAEPHADPVETSWVEKAIQEKEFRDVQALQEIAPDIPIREVLESRLDEDQKRVRKIMRKVDFRLISILAMLYIWAFIDRGNLGNANIAGMSQDLKTNVGNRYSVLAMIFFVGYTIIDIPAAYLTRRLGPAFWLGSCGLAWSVITIGQGFVKTWGQLAVCRVLLGFLEGGLVPGAMYLLSCWYTRFEIHKRIAAFYVVGIASSGLSGLLAYGIENLKGTDGLNGWSWIFIVEGIASGVVALASYFLIVDFPEKAAQKNSLGLPGFLTQEEVAIVLARIEHDRGDAVEEKLTPKLVLTYLKDWKVWEFTSYLMLNNTALYAFSYFLPVILKDGFGYSTGRAQLLTFPPYAVSTVWILLCAWVGDRVRMRGPILCFNCLLYIIGITMVGYCDGIHPRYGGVFLGVMGIVGNIPTQWAYAHNNLVGQIKKALCMALMTMGGAFGGIISGNVYRSQDAPHYRPGLLVSIAFNCVYFLLVAKNFYIFRRQNRRADQGEIIIGGQPGFRYTY